MMNYLPVFNIVMFAGSLIFANPVAAVPSQVRCTEVFHRFEDIQGLAQTSAGKDSPWHALFFGVMSIFMFFLCTLAPY